MVGWHLLLDPKFEETKLACDRRTIILPGHVYEEESILFGEPDLERQASTQSFGSWARPLALPDGGRTLLGVGDGRYRVIEKAPVIIGL
jgi:hypothetical protein